MDINSLIKIVSEISKAAQEKSKDDQNCKSPLEDFPFNFSDTGNETRPQPAFDFPVNEACHQPIKGRTGVREEVQLPTQPPPVPEPAPRGSFLNETEPHHQSIDVVMEKAKVYHETLSKDTREMQRLRDILAEIKEMENTYNALTKEVYEMIVGGE